MGRVLEIELFFGVLFLAVVVLVIWLRLGRPNLLDILRGRD